MVRIPAPEGQTVLYGEFEREKKKRKKNLSRAGIGTLNLIIVLAWRFIICAHDLIFQGDKGKDFSNQMWSTCIIQTLRTNPLFQH